MKNGYYEKIRCDNTVELRGPIYGIKETSDHSGYVQIVDGTVVSYFKKDDILVVNR